MLLCVPLCGKFITGEADGKTDYDGISPIIGPTTSIESVAE